MKPKVRTFSLIKLSVIFSIVFLFIGQFSCRKDGLKSVAKDVPAGKYTQLSQLPASLKIQPAEISNWLAANIPAEDMVDLQLKNAQQKLLDNHHVIKIPIKEGSALFFTKDAAGLKAFGYKWDDKTPGNKLFTGRILSYSFQDQTMRGFSYANGKRLKLGALNFKSVNSSGPTGNPLTTPDDAPKPGSDYISTLSPNVRTLIVHHGQTNRSIFDFFSDLWCVLTGGSLTDTIASPGENNCSRDDGWASQIMSFIANLFGGGNSDPSSYGADPNAPTGINYGADSYTGPSPTDGGGEGSDASAPYEGGPIWVSRWVDTTDPNNCTTTDANGNVVFIQGGCSTGYWESVQVQVNLTSIQKVVIDANANPCIVSIVGTISNTINLNALVNNLFSTTTVANMVQTIANSSSYNVSLTQAVIADVTDAQGNVIRTNAQTVPARGTITITLNTNYLNSATDLSIARTIIHELIHTYFTYGIANSTTDPNFQAFVAENALLFTNGAPTADQNDAQHQQMAASYVNSLATLLEEFANAKGITSPIAGVTLHDYCVRLVWGGLQNTPAYQLFFPGNQFDIKTAINNENTNAPGSTRVKGC